MKCHSLNRAALTCAVLLSTLSCGDQGGGLQGTLTAESACIPGEQRQCACSDGTVSAQACAADGSSYEPCQCTGGTATPTSTSDLPCAVKTVLQENCWTCHSSTPQFGAPMSLTDSADFRAPAKTDATKTVGELALVRIRDAASPMPPPPNTRLTEPEMGVLESWINDGAPSSSCQVTSPTPTATTSPTSTSPLPTTTATTDPTATPTTEPVPPDPSVQCYELRAHDPGTTTGYNVPTTPDLYNCFTFNRPWGSTPVHVVSARSIIDNSQVIHHWILYNNSGGVTEGGISNCSGAHPDAAFIAGWAPGGSDMELPPDVGMVADGAGFTLEIHYNNTLGQGQYDSSGVEICVTDQLRPNAAAIHWLGTENINLPAGGDATGYCDPVNTGPVTIISSSPHMHLQGRHMTTVINRAAGGTDTLIDTPFSFSSQVSYDTPAVVQPGDTLTTTCTYGGPAYFGQGTNEEMCYNFVLAYPAGQLASSFSFARQNGCTGL